MTQEINIILFDLEPMELGYYFFQARDKKQLSLRKLAKLAGTTDSTIFQFENGKRIPSIPTIIRLGKILEIQLKFCIQKNPR